MERTETAVIVDEYRSPRLQIHNNEILTPTGSLAASLIERWGMVAAEPDGEDRAGRAKLRLSTPDELTDRAINVALTFMEKARKAGLVIEAPSIAEMQKQYDELRKKN